MFSPLTNYIKAINQVTCITGIDETLESYNSNKSY